MLAASDTRPASRRDRSVAAAVRRAGGGTAADPRPAHALRVIEILERERRLARTARRRPAR